MSLGQRRPRWRAAFACLAVAALGAPSHAAGSSRDSRFGPLPAMCDHSVSAVPHVSTRDGRHRAMSGSWALHASVSCLAPHQRLEFSARLFRNGRPEPQIAAKSCILGATTPLCQQLDLDGKWSYSAMSGNWSVTLVTFTLGATSTLQPLAEDNCELDIPSLIVGCTYVVPLPSVT